MSDSSNQPELPAIRAELDLLDDRLVGILAERSALIDQVVRYKRIHGVAVVDGPREDDMLKRIEAQATSAGLDPRVARQVLRAIIDAFTLVEVEHLADPTDPS